jgi:two-component system CheB/CheR fusion protein
VITDVPFSKLDIISCRNLFIYIEPNVQKEIINVFHFSLKKDGYLFLGNSETIGKSSYLFETISKKNCLFKRLEVPLKETIKFGTNTHYPSLF